MSAIYLCWSAFETIRNEAEAAERLETGGILLGYEVDNNIVVTHATGPGPYSKRETHRVELDTNYIRSEANRYLELGIGYQGSWHTHPCAQKPTPSYMDRRLLRTVAWSGKYPLKCAVQIISPAPQLEPEQLAGLICRKLTFRVRQAEVILCDDPHA